MTSALDGVHVVDLSWGMAGPMATGQLADHGASVVRVEPPGGDPYRPFVSHAAYDRGKRSVTLDLRSPQGMAVLDRLLERADVLVLSWQPGVAASLGLDYETLRSRHPRLIVCSITGYGVSGPDRDRPGYDSLVSARLGAVAEQQVEGGSPTYLSVPIGSVGAALLAVLGITAALVDREETGEGQEVDTSLLDGALGFLSMFWEHLENLPVAPTSRSTADGLPSRYRLLVKTYRCADGEYLGIHTGAGGSHGRLMEVVGLADRVLPAPPGQQEKKVPLTEEEARILADELPVIIASRPRAEWLERMRSNDVTAIALLRQTEAFHEPQVEHNELIVTLDDPEIGPIEQVGIAARMADTPGAVGAPAPLPGADAVELLAELGFGPDEIATLTAAATSTTQG